MSYKKMAFLAAIAYSFSTSPAISHQPVDPGQESAYREAMKTFRSGDYSEAEKEFLSLREKYPNGLIPLIALADFYHFRFDRFHESYEDAGKLYGEIDLALRAAPPGEADRGFYKAYLDQGVLLLSGGDSEGALVSLDRFKQTYPDYYEMEAVDNYRGVALLRLWRLDESAQAFRSAMAVNPDFLLPRANLKSVFIRLNMIEQARINQRMGHLDDALEATELLVKISGGCLPAIRLKGDILRDLGDKTGALVCYREVIASNPLEPITHGVRLDIAKLLEAGGDLDGALAALNENAALFKNVKNDPTYGEILRIVRILRSRQ
jgi:tetratricopeptide (TPR) repeat protein